MTDETDPFPWTPPREGFVDKHAVAALLGVSTKWVDARATNPEFPSYKFGSLRRYKLSEVAQWGGRARRRLTNAHEWSPSPSYRDRVTMVMIQRGADTRRAPTQQSSPPSPED